MPSKRFLEKVKNLQIQWKVLQIQGSEGSKIQQKISSEGILGPIWERSWQVATNLGAKEHQIGDLRAAKETPRGDEHAKSTTRTGPDALRVLLAICRGG